MTTALMVLAALVMDFLLGEPRRFHPLVGFGRLTLWLERRLYADSVLRGLFAMVLLLAPVVLASLWLVSLVDTLLVGTLVLYLAIGWRSLDDHACRVYDALRVDDLPLARCRAGHLVSRDTADLDRQGIAKATVESVLENGNDAIFGAIFWFALAGVPGVVLYRLGNTLDAMWGYRNARYHCFGRAAARLDDILNYVPARLTALSYALVGNFSSALRCWRIQGRGWKSPNAGSVMAAGAGSLGVLLGGAASYQGELQGRPDLGEGRGANAGHIDQALKLIRRALLLWLAVLLIGGWLVDPVVAG